MSWDTPVAARAYAAFNDSHDRYRDANAVLVSHAALRAGLSVADVGAGLGHTALAALPHLGPGDSILCVEPSAAMRQAAVVDDPRVTWAAALPSGARFDRLLCGAALWLLGPVDAAVPRLAGHLAAGGALAFTMPALYLGVPDPPGGGRDPWLAEGITRLAAGRRHGPAQGWEPCDAEAVGRALARAGLHRVRWGFRRRLTQTAYREWLKIPACTEGVLSGMSHEARADAVDAAFAGTDAGSWRWERWVGWTAWRR